MTVRTERRRRGQVQAAQRKAAGLPPKMPKRLGERFGFVDRDPGYRKEPVRFSPPRGFANSTPLPPAKLPPREPRPGGARFGAVVAPGVMRRLTADEIRAASPGVKVSKP